MRPEDGEEGPAAWPGPESVAGPTMYTVRGRDRDGRGQRERERREREKSEEREARERALRLA